MADITLTNPPEQLWGKGEKDGYCTVVLNVRICRGPNGEVWSTNNFDDKNGLALALKWPGGGARHIAHALLTEALRRETFACALAKLSADRSFLTKYAAAGQEVQTELDRDLAEKVLIQFTDTAKKSVSPCVQEIMAMLLKQQEGHE